MDSLIKKIRTKIKSLSKQTILTHFATLVFGGVSAIILYKIFAESPKALVNRLKKKNVEMDKTLNQVLGQKKKTVRIWIDGCFDLMHFGHANAFRQAQLLGNYLIVGLNSDDEIIKIKGPPIMNQEERYTAVKACRFVDEVVKDCPYIMNREYLEIVFDKYKVDYVVHGDDPCLLPDGTDVFQDAKDMGRFMTIKRTEGVSTTEIIGRILMMSHTHHTPRQSIVVQPAVQHSRLSINYAMAPEDEGPERTVDYSNTSSNAIQFPFIRRSDFLPTGRRIKQFSPNKKPKKNDKIVYIDGSWDLFHAGHIEMLEKAKKLGDFLLVGVHTDDLVNQCKGRNFPILNLHERSLSVMSCRYTDEVIIGAPPTITQQLLTTFNITVVCIGDFTPSQLHNRYKIPREKKILRTIDCSQELSTEVIVNRLFERREVFEDKFKKKYAQEKEYIKNQEYVSEIC